MGPGSSNAPPRGKRGAARTGEAAAGVSVGGVVVGFIAEVRSKRDPELRASDVGVEGSAADAEAKAMAAKRRIRSGAMGCVR